jgi:hypothetical protein
MASGFAAGPISARPTTSAPALPSSLARAGERHLGVLASELDAADPSKLVRAPSRLLCAALGELAAAGYEALGGRQSRADVALGAAALSLLTKLDDEVIDSLAFHGGPATPRETVRTATRRFLAPTLASLRSREPATDEPRCAFAAMVGRRLAALAEPAEEPRLARLLDAIAEGWDVQVAAVTTLTSAPEDVATADVARTTRAISGAWLSMMVLVGTLPADADRGLHESEIDAIWDWGSYIQRADALCDLAKDQGDGLCATYVARRAYETGLVAVDAPGLDALYRHVAAHDIDLECHPPADERARLGVELAELGRVDALLGWIHGMLWGRYLAHPSCARGGGGRS